MGLEAYGTSSYGLRLSPFEFWHLTPREYYALADVQQSEARRWAIGQAMLANANFNTGGVPYTADDFLGISDHGARVQAKQVSDWKARQMNRKLAQLLPEPARGRKGKSAAQQNPEPEDLPLWARKNPPKPDDLRPGEKRYIR